MSDFFLHIIDFVLHIDAHLIAITGEYAKLTYLILFFIIFCETGLIVTPFLPGDSLLFAVGTITALPDTQLTLAPAILTLVGAAILGDFVNYFTGKWFGKRWINEEKSFIKKEYIHETQNFFKKYGSMAVVYGRFLPIFRTFVPFVSGIAQMHYKKFVRFNVLGALIWVSAFILLGHFFGNIPVIRSNFSYAILAIIFISIIPPIIQFFKIKQQRKKS